MLLPINKRDFPNAREEYKRAYRIARTINRIGDPYPLKEWTQDFNIEWELGILAIRSHVAYTQIVDLQAQLIDSVARNRMPDIYAEDIRNTLGWDSIVSEAESSEDRSCSLGSYLNLCDHQYSDFWYRASVSEESVWYDALDSIASEYNGHIESSEDGSEYLYFVLD